jgi:hypothetical protein
LGSEASPVDAASEPESGSLFCFFFLQKKEVLPCLAFRVIGVLLFPA